MPKKNNFNKAQSNNMMMSSKTSTLNDNIKNAGKQQNTGAMLNMPTGAKKPENTPK